MFEGHLHVLRFGELPRICLRSLGVVCFIRAQDCAGRAKMAPVTSVCSILGALPASVLESVNWTEYQAWLFISFSI